MRRLIVAGLLYLTGIAVILLIKPQYMFREDGRWKEFGIGRDPRHFTNIPFWLFAIIWAVLSYVFVALLEDAFYGESEYSEPDTVVENSTPIRNSKRNTPENKLNSNAPKELIPGYYMLNEGATGRNGVPRYVYVGAEEP